MSCAASSFANFIFVRSTSPLRHDLRQQADDPADVAQLAATPPRPGTRWILSASEESLGP
jgi:hypothetical protein